MNHEHKKMASRQGIGDTMQNRELELGFVSKREIDQFLRGIKDTPCEKNIQKAVIRMASQFEKALFEFALEKRVKKVLSVKHTEYRWSEGRIDTYFKFFTEDEKYTAIEYAKNFGEYVIDHDFTALADMSDEEFLRFSFSYTGYNEDIVRKWRNAVRKVKDPSPSIQSPQAQGIRKGNQKN